MKDLGRAFNFMFKDPSWVQKCIIAAVFMILCIIGLGFFVLAGYFVQLTQRVMRREKHPLPDWNDIGIKFVVGFKFVVAYFLYILPVIVLLVPVVILATLSEVSEQPAIVGVVSAVYMFGFILLVVPYSLALSMLMPVIMYRFAEKERIGDALHVGEIIGTFKRNWQNCLIVALITIGIQSFAAVGIVFLFVGIFFTLFYAYAVSAYLYGALYLAEEGAAA